MKMMQTLLFFVQGIPEIAGVIACSLALAGVKLRWTVILVFAGILTPVVYIVRSLPVTFGLHTLVGILLSTLFVARATRVSPSTSFVVVFASYAVLALLEVSMHELSSVFLQREVVQLLSEQYTRMLIGLPQAIVMIAIALVIARYRKPREGMWRI